MIYTNPQSCFQASNTSREATEEGRRLSEVILILKTGFLRITVLLGTRRIKGRTIRVMTTFAVVFLNEHFPPVFCKD